LIDYKYHFSGLLGKFTQFETSQYALTIVEWITTFITHTFEYNSASTTLMVT